MELQQSEQASVNRKKKIRNLFAVFIGVLIGFTLFSNTLLTMTLPKVAVVQPSLGKIQYQFTGNGTVKPREVSELTQGEGWEVKKVYVKEGDLVAKGQTLVSYDSSEAQWQLKLEMANLEKLQLGMQGVHNEYIEAARVDDQDGMLGAKNSIKNKQIDLEILEHRIQMLQEKLESNREIAAPYDGLIKEVNVTEGLSGTRGGPAIQISNQSQGFEFELHIPAHIADMLKIGGKLVVGVEGTSTRQVEGQISEIDYTSTLSEENAAMTTTVPSVKSVLITLQDKTFQGGEQVQVHLNLSKASDEDMLLVSNQAIREDPTGTYIYTIEERKGPLGNAFYVNKVYITVVEANVKLSAVQGVFEMSQIILESSQPLQEGDRVRM